MVDKAAQLKFELKNIFSQYLWEPEPTGEQPAKHTPNGVYTVGVLYSLERSTRSKNANAAALAQALLKKITDEIDALQIALTEQRDKLRAELVNDVLQVPEFSRPKAISIEPDRVRESIVKFIRCFIVHDQVMHALHEQSRHQMIDKSTFMRRKKELSSPLRHFMSDTSKVSRLYHQQRKVLIAQDKTDMDISDQAARA